MRGASGRLPFNMWETPVFVTDTAEVAGVRRTQDGYLVADVRAGRAGIQLYAGSELGRPDMPMVKVYRPPEEVFDRAAMSSAAHRPVTVRHPLGDVNSKNWKDLAVGMTGPDVARDGDFIRVPLILMDQAAIDRVQSGERELSFGYTCRLEWAAGQTQDGDEYQAIQRQIRINHLAVVDRGRAGPECRIGDEAGPQINLDGDILRAIVTKSVDGLMRRDVTVPANTPPSNNTGARPVADEMRTVVVDGLSIPTTPQGAEMIGRLQQQLSDARNASAAATAAHNTELQSRDGQIAALRSQQTQEAQAHDGAMDTLRATHAQEIAALRGELDAVRAQTTDAAMDARVTARANLVGQARRVLGDSFDPAGHSDAAIRRAVVARARPGLPITDATPEPYITAAFDVVMASPDVATAPRAVDPLRNTIMGQPAVHAQDRAQQGQPTPFQRYADRLGTAWMHPNGTNANGQGA